MLTRRVISIILKRTRQNPLSDEQIQRTIIVKYAWKLLETPYTWGGDDFSGRDCSGVIHDLLQAIGIEKRGFDCTAHDLYIRFRREGNIIETTDRRAGDLVFWFKAGHCNHVGILIEDNFVINAGGGGRKVKTREDAIKYNAYIRIDPLDHRGDSFKICNPFGDQEENNGEYI
jgi:cell wall-associated NlpC family hydrolase